MANKKTKKTKLNNNKQNTPSKAKQQEKEKQILAKQAELQKKAQRQQHLKQAGIVIVCVILVFALAIPTVALSLLSS